MSVYIPPELRRSIFGYAPSGIVSDKEAYYLIKEMYPNFSLSEVYYRYLQWRTVMDCVESCGLSINDEGPYEFKRMYDKLKDTGYQYVIENTGKSYNLFFNDMPFTDILGTTMIDVNLDEMGNYNYKQVIPYGSSEYDNIKFIVKYFNALNNKPYNTDIVSPPLSIKYDRYYYIHSPIRNILYESEFNIDVLNTIKELDPEFSLKDLYHKLLYKYKCGMKLDRYLVQDLLEQYSNIIEVIQQKGIVTIVTHKPVEIWSSSLNPNKTEATHYYGANVDVFTYEFEGDVQKFMSIMAHLEHDISQTLLENSLIYDTEFSSTFMGLDIYSKY